jgi:hypothetical protein
MDEHWLRFVFLYIRGLFLISHTSHPKVESKNIAPALDILATEHPEITFAKVEANSNRALQERW